MRPSSDHSDVGYIWTWTKTEGKRAGMLQKQWKRLTFVLQRKAVETIFKPWFCNGLQRHWLSGYKFLIEGTGKIVVSNQGGFSEDFYPYRNHNMIERRLNDIAELDILIIDRGDYEWIMFAQEINPRYFENIPSGESTNSYIFRSTINPRLHMGVRHEEFFQSLLVQRTGELASSARALVGRCGQTWAGDCTLGGTTSGGDGQGVIQQGWASNSRTSRMKWAERMGRSLSGQMHLIVSIKVSETTPLSPWNTQDCTTRDRS
jgi:hypothetical protein